MLYIILAPWRSGTTFLTNSLMKLPKTKLISEPIIVREWIGYYYAFNKKACLEKVLNFIKLNLRACERDNIDLVIKEPNMCFIVDELVKEFGDEIKFIKLTRNFGDWKESYMNNNGGWYGDKMEKDDEKLILWNPFLTTHRGSFMFIEEFKEMNEKDRLFSVWHNFNDKSWDEKICLCYIPYEEMVMKTEMCSKLICEFMNRPYKHIFKGAYTHRIGIGDKK